MTLDSRSCTVAFAIAFASITAACAKDNAVETNTNNVCARGETTCRGDELHVCNASLTGFDLLGYCAPGSCIQGKSTCPGVDAGSGGNAGETDSSTGAGGAEFGGSSGSGGTGDGGASGEGDKGGAAGTGGASGKGGTGGVDAGAGGTSTGGTGGAAETGGAAGAGGAAGTGGTSGVGGASGSVGTGGAGGSSGCPNNCVDGKACTDDLCTAGTCSNPLKADWCFIGNACVAKDAAQSGNVCMTCQPSASTSKYTAVPDAAAKSCGIQQVCKAGACVSDCEDADGDGYGTGTTCLGPDCNDGDYNNWLACDTCIDGDGDGYSLLCDQYVSNGVKGPDCDDETPFCTSSCADGDTNGVSDCSEYWVTQLKSTSGPEYNRIVPTSDGGMLLVTRSDVDAGQSKLVRYSNKGRLLWVRLLPTESGYAGAAIQTSDGGFLLGGYYGSGIGLGAMVTRLDFSGAMLWQKRTGVSYSDRVLAVTEAPDGNFLVVGTREVKFKTYPQTALYGGLFWLAKLNKTGNTVLWEKAFGPLPMLISTTVDLVAIGGGELAVALGGLIDPGGGSAGSRLLRFDGSGNLLWQKQFGMESTATPAHAMAIASTSDGNLVVALDLSSSDCSSTGGLLVTAFDSSGAVVWSKKTLVTNLYMPSLSLAADSTGHTYLRAGSVAGVCGAAQAADWLVRFDSAGNIDWNRKFSPISDGYITDWYPFDMTVHGSRLLVVERQSAGTVLSSLPLTGTFPGCAMLTSNPMGFANATPVFVAPTYWAPVALTTSLQDFAATTTASVVVQTQKCPSP